MIEINYIQYDSTNNFKNIEFLFYVEEYLSNVLIISIELLLDF